MSYADNVFIENCRDILENGFSTENEKVRPVWEDGTPAYTIKKFGVINRYETAKGILFTFSVDIVVKKCLITHEQPESPSGSLF